MRNLDMVDRVLLARWLDEHGVPGEGELPDLRLLAGGASNVVVEIERGGHRTVLRRPPWDAPAGRGATMLREHRILAALADTDVPHARVHGAAADAAIAGAPFYVMEFVNGWSPASVAGWPEPFDADAAARRGLAIELVEVLAKVAAVDWRAHGLAELGRPDGFHDRQVDRWLAAWEPVRTREVPGLAEAAAWLRARRPRRFEPGLMHGDYQFANVLYAHGAPARLLAVVDWELATIGDPLLDLAWVIMSRDWDGTKFDLSGLPDTDELVERYARRCGHPVEDFDYYLVLARFKMAVILEGGYARAARTPGTNPAAERFGPLALQLAETAGAMAGATRAGGIL